ncbi:hypothetical protein LIER_15821 [Lithospermum erythrorhizon]|uniref:RING-type E3 ubiquitin transferase n=1 Tax=Lithospermum erythrorhizon TaxID=34254 RepID=A0AAV3Q8X8_LITER
MFQDHKAFSSSSSSAIVLSPLGIVKGSFFHLDSHNLPPLTSPESPCIDKPIHASHTNFPILAVAIIGILATAFLLVGYYTVAIKCLNWNRIDLLGRVTFSRRRRIDYPLVHSQSAENQGLDEALIRYIPIFIFKKSDVKDGVERTYLECSVCLNEFQENEKLRCLPNCAHVFHIDCTDVWLQNNVNCPLCRNRITISVTPTYPMDHILVLHGTSMRGSGGNFPGRGEDFNGNEIGEHNHKFGTNRDLVRIQDRLNSKDLSVLVSISPSPKKLQQPKMLQKKGEKCNLISSMGDECIDISKKDEQIYVQPIRRSMSMDSAADRQLYLTVQDILQQQRQQSDACLSEENSNRVKKSCFSFGHRRGSNRAVLPVVS